MATSTVPVSRFPRKISHRRGSIYTVADEHTVCYRRLPNSTITDEEIAEVRKHLAEKHRRLRRR